jgi:hypothetical protein
MGNSMKQTNKKRRLFEDDEIFGKPGTDAIPLSAVDKKAAQFANAGGGEKDNNPDDDKVPFSKVSVAAGKLKPSQKEVVPAKAVAFAILALLKKQPMQDGPGGDLQAIISNDNYIMDGHHRWAATFLCDPSATLDATQIDLPGGALVTALNVVTKGMGRTGNTGTGDISAFGGKPVEDEIRLAAEKGIKGATAEEVTKALTDFGGSVDGAVEKMLANAAKMPKSIPSWAPKRVDMPVINAPEVAAVAKKIAAGSVDIKPPYSPDVAKKVNPTGAKTEGIITAMESYYQMRTGKKQLNEIIMKSLRDYNRVNQKRLQESYTKKVKKQRLQEKLSNLLRPLVEESLKRIIKNKLK